MNFSSSPISRAMALLGLLLVAITMVCASMSIEPGVWQMVYPLVVLGAGAVLVVQYYLLLTQGGASLTPSFVWRFSGAFGFFIAAFALLVVSIPVNMWEITKDITPLPEGMVAGVDTRLREVVDISGPLNPLSILVVGILLMVVAFLGSIIESDRTDVVTTH